jgi:hypothetical protein
MFLSSLLRFLGLHMDACECESCFRVQARSASGANRHEAMLIAHQRIALREREYELARAEGRKLRPRPNVLSLEGYKREHGGR